MNQRKNFIALAICLILLGCSKNTFAQPSNYIEQYKDIAIREMHRSGIPASITLAQGILESSWGNGSLALNANNHFGIKCKSYWKGPTFYIEDDDYKNGKLMKSCFRAYDNAEDSYVDHTDFLVNNPRYQRLFKYQLTDYRKWAHGLKKCGYATDKKYAYKLIRTINKYKLYEYDLVPEQLPMAMASNESAPPLETVFAQNNSTQPIPVTVPSKRISPAPEAFVLPENYKRGDGLRQLGTKGDQVIRNSSSILWKK